jgi:hypothetical protein
VFVEDVRCPHPQQKASSHKQATCDGATQRAEIGDTKNRVEPGADVGDDNPNQHDADVVEKAPKESHSSQIVARLLLFQRLRFSIPVRMRRPAGAQEAPRFNPLVKTCGADASRIKGIPLVAACAEPLVFLAGDQPHSGQRIGGSDDRKHAPFPWDTLLSVRRVGSFFSRLLQRICRGKTSARRKESQSVSKTPESSKRPTEQGVGLASNTRNLLLGNIESRRPTTRAEYHFLSGRELYDKNIITADRYSSGAAAWALHFEEDFYRVAVISRPFRQLPQILCLSFEGGQDESLEAIAIEFLSLLSVFAREPLMPLGIRRLGNDPISLGPEYRPLTRQIREVRRPPMALDSQAIQTILKGIAESESGDINAALAACKFYQAALSFMEFDRSMAYVSFVSAIECLAGRYYQNEKLTIDQRPSQGLRHLHSNHSRIGGHSRRIPSAR